MTRTFTNSYFNDTQEFREGHIQVIGKTTSEFTFLDQHSTKMISSELSQRSVLEDLLGKADAGDEKVSNKNCFQFEEFKSLSIMFCWAIRAMT